MMFFYRNHQLHWAVFQKGGLPDGTELTYVSQGKVKYLIIYMLINTNFLKKKLTSSINRNFWMVINGAMEYTVPVAKLRSVPHCSKLMRAGPLAKNREYMFFFLFFTDLLCTDFFNV